MTKGLSLDQINQFPKMKRKDVLAYLKKKLKKESNHEEEKQSAPRGKQTKNDQEESKKVKSSRRKSGFHVRKSEQDEVDEIIDGDEGIINRKLPINNYNYQVLNSGEN